MKTRAHTLALATAVLALLGCARQESMREIDWAKAALARNPSYEIVATDETAGVFTVRDTVNGSMQALRLEDLIATPKPPKIDMQPATPIPENAPAAEPAAPDPEVPDDGANALANAQTTGEAEGTASEAGGEALASGPGYSIKRADDAPPPKPATLEGPGYSITRHEAQSGESSEGGANAQTSSEAIAAGVEPRSDPIVCQGERLMHIDGETLQFTGDALIAEEGCDLYISNANIRAGGVGIIARRARVHIVNSTIGGQGAAYEVSEGAEIYVTSTTFSGIGRRFDNATLNDLGGNAYNLAHEQ